MLDVDADADVMGDVDLVEMEGLGNGFLGGSRGFANGSIGVLSNQGSLVKQKGSKEW